MTSTPDEPRTTPEGDSLLEQAKAPSWLRWPPNCCETCTGWSKDSSDRWIGTCMSGDSLEMHTRTDSRYRCPSFKRKEEI